MEDKIYVYFPKSFLTKYIDEDVIENFNELPIYEKVQWLSRMTKIRHLSPDDEVYVTIDSSLAKFYRKYVRSAFYKKKYFCIDVIPFFRNYDPETIKLDDEIEEYELKLDESSELNRLKISVYSAIDRLVFTDLVFRMYLHLTSSELKYLIREIHKLPQLLPPEIEVEVEEVKKVYNLNLGGNSRIWIVIPHMLKGFIETAFPLLNFSTVIQLAIMYCIYSDRYEVYDVSLPKDEYTKRFIVNWKFNFEEFVYKYKESLDDYIDKFKEAISKVDVIEEFIINYVKSHNGISLEKFLSVASKLWSEKKVINKLYLLSDLGKIDIRNDRLYIR